LRKIKVLIFSFVRTIDGDAFARDVAAEIYDRDTLARDDAAMSFRTTD
jgi:hypothetical protein